jgi:hypothetical protein
MKSIAIFGILILTASLVLGGMTNTVFAQENPSILSQIANRAQEQIQNQISNDSSEEIKKLFEEGKKEVEALEESLSNNDLTSAKKYFLSSMKIFTQISHQLNTVQTSQTSTSMIQTAKNPSIDLLRMQGYVNNLKVIAKNNNASMDFSSLDQSFEITRNQIDNNQFKEASQTIHEIKKTIIELNAELRQQTSQQETNRAQAFAQKYLKQLDRLIEHGQNTGMPKDIMLKFESAHESLTLATSPSEVIKEVRKILLLQQQFDISENKLVELRIIQNEKAVLELSNLDQVNQVTIQEIKETLLIIKDHLSKNEFEQANELLRSLAITLEQIQI